MVSEWLISLAPRPTPDRATRHQLFTRREPQQAPPERTLTTWLRDFTQEHIGKAPHVKSHLRHQTWSGRVCGQKAA